MWNGDNPCIGVDVGRKKVKREKKLLTGDEICGACSPRSMIRCGRSFDWRSVPLFGNISEILGLKWDDFDFANGTVTVSRRWHRGNMDDPKSEASRRIRQLGPRSQPP